MLSLPQSQRTGQLSGPSEPGLVNPAFEEGEDGIATLSVFLLLCITNIITKPNEH